MRLSRRSFVTSLMASGLALVSAPALVTDAEEIRRRYWALDRTHLVPAARVSDVTHTMIGFPRDWLSDEIRIALYTGEWQEVASAPVLGRSIRPEGNRVVFDADDVAFAPLPRSATITHAVVYDDGQPLSRIVLGQIAIPIGVEPGLSFADEGVFSVALA
jgi:hypothetical protein